MEDKIAHLGFIQSIINRMATNSFLIKGWCITLVAAMFALSSKDSNIRFVILALFPTIAFLGYPLKAGQNKRSLAKSCIMRQ